MTLDEVLERLLSAAAPRRITDTDTLSTTAALGRVLGEDIVSPLDVPPADNSSMDGYAVRVADLAVPGTDRKSTRLNSSHSQQSRMPSSA